MSVVVAIVHLVYFESKGCMTAYKIEQYARLHILNGTLLSIPAEG